MASLELVDHTLELRPWRLPEQQHGAQQQDTIDHLKNAPRVQRRAQRRAISNA
jgi:hypothetical protein